jgi:hypothetical protein
MIPKLYKFATSIPRDRIRLAFGYFCMCGNLDVARQLYGIFHLTADDARSMDNRVLVYSCVNGHLEVIRWLHSTFHLTADDATRAYAFRNRIRNPQIVQLLRDIIRL